MSACFSSLTIITDLHKASYRPEAVVGCLGQKGIRRLSKAREAAKGQDPSQPSFLAQFKLHSDKSNLSLRLLPGGRILGDVGVPRRSHRHAVPGRRAVTAVKQIDQVQYVESWLSSKNSSRASSLKPTSSIIRWATSGCCSKTLSFSSGSTFRL